jgi:uncharacterized repeat protein (TIGR01451 family)
MTQMSKRLQWTLLTAAMVLFYLPGAAGADPLESRMTAYRVEIDATGTEVLEETSHAAPGEVIEYRLEYRNNGDSPIGELIVVGPIPANTHYVPDSAATPVRHEFRVSIDGGKTWDPEPVRRLRPQSDGSMQTVVVSAEEYSHLRWTAKEPLPPEQSQTYRYRVRIR